MVLLLFRAALFVVVCYGASFHQTRTEGKCSIILLVIAVHEAPVLLIHADMHTVMDKYRSLHYQLEDKVCPG